MTDFRGASGDRDQLERDLTVWLREEAPPAAPRPLAERVRRSTSGVRQSRLPWPIAIDALRRRAPSARAGLGAAAAMTLAALGVFAIVNVNPWGPASPADVCPSGESLPAASPGPPFRLAGTLVQSRVLHTATHVGGGCVLVVGGMSRDGDVDTVLASVELWDTAASTSRSLAPLEFPRQRHTATRLPDGRVVVIGGYAREQGMVAPVEQWDPATQRFRTVGRLATARSSHSATLLQDGRILVVGGATDFRTLHDAELYDPETGTTTPAGESAVPRGGHTATLLRDGAVLVIGGGTGGRDLTAHIEVWDPPTGKFWPIPPLPDGGRAGHTATLLADGRVLVVGGDESRTAVLWDWSTWTFSPAGTTFAPRLGGHTATLLEDGRVLVVGGGQAAEVWDPVSMAFTTLATDPTSIHAHAVTSLPNGWVIVTGGLDGAAPGVRSLDSVLLYVPDSGD